MPVETFDPYPSLIGTEAMYLLGFGEEFFIPAIDFIEDQDD